MKGNLVRLDDNFHKEVKDYCNEYGYSFNGLVKALLRKKINE